MRDVCAQAPLRIAIDVANSTLADRLAAALSDVQDLELVGRDREADVVVVATALGGALLALA